MKVLTAVAVLCTAAVRTRAHQPQCPRNADGLAVQMLESTIARGQGITGSGAATSTIELGIFQQALRESIACGRNETQRQHWAEYLQNSTSGSISLFSNATADAGQPLDRLSVGTSMIYQYRETGDEEYLPAIAALQDSVKLQPQNANGGLWYYANPNNLSAYHNLSYSDGMFSYPAFALLSGEVLSVSNATVDRDLFGLAATVKQIARLYGICKNDAGLVVHGYDASKAHAWANPITGASPVVWGRSLAWYTLGISNALEILQSLNVSRDASDSLGQLFESLVSAQLAALERSLGVGGAYGVWQVVDQPGANFQGHGNFIEASASCMTAYSLLRGARLGFIEDANLRRRAISAGIGIYHQVLHEFLVSNDNGTLSLNGTSAVASLSGDVDFTYYVTRPVVLNSLIGISAFILAGLEVEKVC
ncbi:Six-hairpin glycosidase [Lecanosticta acicola]|uniref:Six-hairpin glycosidase n=1 Tax=Lecanosticta acicola TaxID=111012 RepID=A0AAI9EDD1_9PEZI|nr:Six-hairpin glycosidase [Lecanosticta acicola]